MSMKNGTSRKNCSPEGRNRLCQYKFEIYRYILYNVSMFFKNFVILGTVRLDQYVRKISYSIKYLFQSKHSTFPKASQLRIVHKSMFVESSTSFRKQRLG